MLWTKDRTLFSRYFPQNLVFIKYSHWIHNRTNDRGNFGAGDGLGGHADGITASDRLTNQLLCVQGKGWLASRRGDNSCRPGCGDPVPCIIRIRFLMRKILRPSFWKIVLAATLLYASSALWRAYVIRRISDTFPLGFPFQFYLAWGPCPPGEICFEINWLYLVLDMLIWYVISAFIVQWLKDRRSAR